MGDSGAAPSLRKPQKRGSAEKLGDGLGMGRGGRASARDHPCKQSTPANQPLGSSVSIRGTNRGLNHVNWGQRQEEDLEVTQWKIQEEDSRTSGHPAFI